MEITLVNPIGFDTIYTIPLSLGYLKSNIDNAKHDVRIIDCALLKINAKSTEFKRKIKDFNPDVIGVTCWSPMYEESMEVLKIAKEINKNVITIMGGAHATSNPDRVMKNMFVDFIFRGESELSFPLFLDEIEKDTPDLTKIKGLVYRSENNIVKNEMQREEDLDKIKIPDYDAIGLQDYIESGYLCITTDKMNAPIWVTRGCPYRCAFCSANLQNGKIVRAHSVKYVIDWIKHLYKKGIKTINIIDDNFTYNVDYAKDLCREIIKLNLKDLQFGTPNGIRIQRTDSELLKLMKKAGWKYVIIAIESGSEKVLKNMRKDLDLKIIPQKVKEVKEAGLKVYAFFIIGYPNETREDIKKTIKLLRKCRFNFFFLSNFQPLPGTSVYNELVKNKEIPDGFLPKHYSTGEAVYISKELKGFNFPLLRLREYTYLALSQPLNILYLFKLISPKMAISRIYTNLINSLKSK